MIDLNNLTILIPVKIESYDRYYNLKIVLGYLNKNFKTNIKIIESDETSKIDFLKEFKNLNIDYSFQKLDKYEPYHRTKYLNEMIYSSETELVSNYDCDVLLPINTYVEVVSKLINDESDFIYPYKKGNGQKRLFYSQWYNSDYENNMHIFSKNFDLNIFENDPNTDIYSSLCGHSIFAKKESYINSFMENENFISYGPEDQERMYRFSKLGYRVEWYDNYVYHIEHTRSNDSWTTNPFFKKNCDLFEYIKTLSENDLINLYNSYDYIKKYKKI